MAEKYSWLTASAREQMRVERMQAGQHVVFLNDPLGRGVGVILEVTKAGKLLVEWDYDEGSDRPNRMYHEPHDIELESTYYGREPEALTARDFDALRKPNRTTS